MSYDVVLSLSLLATLFRYTPLIRTDQNRSPQMYATYPFFTKRVITYLVLSVDVE